MKHISFVKEATNTTGLEAQKTNKAYGNWAKAFLARKIETPMFRKTCI